MIYALAFIVLCLILWQWKQKIFPILIIGICIIIGMFFISILEKKYEESSLSTIPCAVINVQIGNKQIIKDENGTQIVTDESKVNVDAREDSLENSLNTSYTAGFVGELSNRNLKNLVRKKNIADDKVVDYFIDGKLITSSLFINAYKQCGENGDYYILIENTTNKVINYEKFMLSARRRNHSTNLLDVNERDYRDDHVIRQGEVVGICHKFPNLRRQKIDMSDLTFDVELKGVKSK